MSKTLDLFGAEADTSPLVPVPDTDMGTSDLPEGWTWATVKDVSAKVDYGYTDSARSEPVGPRFLRITDVQDGKVDWETVPYCEIEPQREDTLRLAPGDIVFARTGATTGKSFLIRSCPRAVFASYLIRVRPLPTAIHSKYLSYFFGTASYWSQISDKSQGTGQPNCNGSKLASLIFPLPPLAEQARIVAAIEGALAHVGAARELLARVPVLLKRFRQSVLAAACSGRLTADWRDANPETESASVLLEHIAQERRATEGKKYKQPAPPDVTDLPELPDTWQWTAVDSVLPTGGIFDGPFGSDLKSSDYTEAGVRVIRLENIGHLSFIEEKRTYVSDTKHHFLMKHTVYENDIIFSSFISDELRVCLLPNIGRAIAKADCFCLRPIAHVNRPYLVMQLASRQSHDFLAGDIHGATRPRVNTTQVRRLPVAIAPTAEQVEIVRRVEGLLALAGALEKRVIQVTARVEKTTQAVLAKAFRGELVPTEAELASQEGRTYETASELLARVAQSHADSTPARIARRRKT